MLQTRVPLENSIHLQGIEGKYVTSIPLSSPQGIKEFEIETTLGMY